MELFYDNDCCTVYCGDCIEVMNTLVKQGKSVDKIITSPPYNTMRQTDDQGYDLYKDERINSEYIDWTIDVFNCYDKLLSQNGCVAYNMSYGTENTEVMNLTVAEIIKRTNFTLADILIWKKNSATPNNVSNNKMTRICEFVYIFCRRSEFFTFTSNKKVVSTSAKGQLIYENMFNYFSAPNNNESNSLNHATFSTEFVDEIIHRYVKKDDVVLDNFCGTGTTLKACMAQNIKSIGIEISRPQCEYIVERLKKGVQMSMIDWSSI